MPASYLVTCGSNRVNNADFTVDRVLFVTLSKLGLPRPSFVARSV